VSRRWTTCALAPRCPSTRSRPRVERYIAWPGQALAYKLGEIQIRRHRREAEAALGPKFDQRRFHDVILALGSVPLAVLEERMAQFIKNGGEPQTPAGR
jgi:uncharacterized protein (DUF885 family)